MLPWQPPHPTITSPHSLVVPLLHGPQGSRHLPFFYFFFFFNFIFSFPSRSSLSNLSSRLT